jgi:hypothetical protein
VSKDDFKGLEIIKIKIEAILLITMRKQKATIYWAFIMFLGQFKHCTYVNSFNPHENSMR